MRKKLYPFISILMLALFLGACSNEDILPEIDQGTNSEATSRTLTFEGYMPDDGPSTRVSIQEGENRAIDFAWEMGDKLDLLFVQETTEAIGTAEVTKLNADGQGATFSVEVPTEITKENPYSFYGVYGGAKNTNGEPIYDATNTALLKLPTIDTEGLKTENTRQNVMLHFAKENYTETEGVTPTLQFNHVGFMFTINIKVTGANFEQSFTDITNVKLAPVDATGNAITENSADYYINLKTGEFANNGDEANTFTFQYAEKNADKNIITVRNWFPQTGAAWPAQKLSVTANSVEALTARQTTAGKTTAIGDSYYLYATWDGASALDFVNKNEMEPKGTKENPYSVAEAIANYTTHDGFAWVRGYIVGYNNNNYIFSADGAPTNNVLIADAISEEDGNNTLTVELKVASGELNLKDNPEQLLTEVLFHGTFTNYYGKKGLKGVNDYEILSTTPLFQADNTPINFTSSLELTRTIAITTNEMQEWTAASSDESWLTVAPASGTGSGDVTITATENTDTEAGRTATVTLTAIDNAELAPIVIDVTQKAFEASIIVDPASLTFAKEGGSETIAVTANVAWTATSDAAWATISPANGTNDGTITVIAEANTGAEARSAIITITGSDVTTTVSVTQAGSSALPPELLFPGSDFNNWSAFIGALDGNLLFAKENATGGRGGSGAMHLEGQHTKNDYVFTAVVPEGFSAEGKTMIHFWVKGTAAKSLSMNMYGPKGNHGAYQCYNMGDLTSAIVLEPKLSNSYTGNVNTNGEWIKVTLDISSIVSEINSTPGESLFALKVGSKADYDLFVDDITIE